MTTRAEQPPEPLGVAEVGPVVDLGGNLRREYLTASLGDAGTWAVWVYRMRRGGVPTLQPARFAAVAVYAYEIEARTGDPDDLTDYDEGIRTLVELRLDAYDEAHHLRG